VAPALAWLKPDIKDYESDGSKVGFIYGLMMDYSFTKNYAIGVGLEVSYRGGKLKYERLVSQNVTETGNFEFDIKYIEIPLTIKLKTNEIGYLTYYGQFGVQPGVNIGAKMDYEYTVVNPSAPPNTQSDTDVDIQDDIVDSNFSILFGAGVEYRISGNTSLMGGLQFSNGFTDLFKLNDPGGTPVKAISNYFSLNIGVFF
jgi:opacity protein-like surface antigen